MKQGTVLTRAVMLLLFAAVCAYFAVAAWQSFHQSEYTMATYAYTVDDAVEATGLLVRQEEVILSGQAAAIVDVIPDQGEKVNAGGTVAYLYRDEAALERKRELRTLELEREQLIYSLQRGDTGWDNARLDQSIVDAMVGLKTSAAYGDLTGLEDQVLSFKSLVIRRGASSAGGAADIQAKVEEIDAQHAALQAAAGQDTTPIRVDKSGSFSAVADGYEALLTPDMLSTLTVSDLTALLVRKPEAPEGAVGKLITSSTWYFTAALPVKTAERLVEGRSVKVRFSRDWSGEVSMTIERVGEEEFDDFEPPVSRVERKEKARDARESTGTLYSADPEPRRSNKVVNIHTTTQLQVVLVKPDRFENAAEIADHLREKRTVVLNLEQTNKDIARRLLDFLSGVAYANEGKIKKVAISTYIITPYNVDILGDLIDELENNGLYF